MSISRMDAHEKRFGVDRAMTAMRETVGRKLSKRVDKEWNAVQAARAEPPVATAAIPEAWPLPGLAPMTRVRTSFGDVHAAALRKGDEVLTRGGKYLPILWLTRISLDEHVLRSKPDSNPVVLAPGSLGPNIPAIEIMVSPRQIVCAGNGTAIESDREAATLISRPGIRRLPETSLSYTMFHVGERAEVYCEGAYMVFPMDA